MGMFCNIEKQQKNVKKKPIEIFIAFLSCCLRLFIHITFFIALFFYPCQMLQLCEDGKYGEYRESMGNIVIEWEISS